MSCGSVSAAPSELATRRPDLYGKPLGDGGKNAAQTARRCSFGPPVLVSVAYHWPGALVKEGTSDGLGDAESELPGGTRFGQRRSSPALKAGGRIVRQELEWSDAQRPGKRKAPRSCELGA